MEESQNFGHEHPLLPLNEEQISGRSEKADCFRCGEKVSAPSFSCVECRFYLHKKCAEAPLELYHPFHRDHPLVLLEKAPYAGSCDFCRKRCEWFVYHCSCKLDFHIKCALFTYNIAKKNFEELEHVACEDSLISTENDIAKDLKKCFGCWESLANSAYFSGDCGYFIHKKCAELPMEIKNICHLKHPLVLQFNSERLACKICQENRGRRKELVYCCSPCEFTVHIECVSLSPISEDKSHRHTFTQFFRRSSFICDACGIEGLYLAYICCACNIMVHKKCISLPRIIKSKWHDHRIFHTYFFQGDLKSLDCVICHDEVNPEHGSYSCLDCNIIFHVNCVTKDEDSYFLVSLENEDEESSESLALLPESLTVIERNDAGEATKIKHFMHIHNLTLSDKTVQYDKCCEGCMLPVLDSFYHCLECDFFLHKACAELHKMKHVWHHRCRQPLMLTSSFVFRCEECYDVSSGFAYKCEECEGHICLRCVIALTPGALTCRGHEHTLLYYFDYQGQCSACGVDTYGALRCKECNFTLDCLCFSLPTTTRHKCDKHLLTLTYHDDNKYSECHYCDICEERRDPNRWFYQCITCDNSVHIHCVLGEYPFVKLGSIFEEKDHPHPLTFVKKIYHYPECIKCDKPCQDLALECAECGCNYIVHWNCMRQSHPLGRWNGHLPLRR